MDELGIEAFAKILRVSSLVRTRLHAVQQRIADTHGSQCGFCTPGIVMSMYTLLRNNPKPAMTDVETYMQVSRSQSCLTTQLATAFPLF